MKAKDIFGIIVRTVGLFAVIYSISSFVTGIAAGVRIYFLAISVPALIVGIVLMRFARGIVLFCYQENKDDSDA